MVRIVVPALYRNPLHPMLAFALSMVSVSGT
jgi:hypothetical protein